VPHGWPQDNGPGVRLLASGEFAGERLDGIVSRGEPLACALLGGEPFARKPLRLGDLRCRHLGGQLLAPLERRSIAADRREVEPFMRHDEIGFD
jgi:hypothetical protein